MKVISILQPWASLLVLNFKTIETRSWNTKYRGEILIHASAKWTNTLNTIACQEPFYSCLTSAGFIGGRSPHKCGLPLGAIIGQGTIVGTAKTEDILLMRKKGIPIHEGNPYTQDWDNEIAFGDYSPNRYGWLLSDIIQFKNPIPAKGSLGLWDYKGALTEYPLY